MSLPLVTHSSKEHSLVVQNTLKGRSRTISLEEFRVRLGFDV